MHSLACHYYCTFTFNLLLYFLPNVFTMPNRKGCSKIVHMHSLAMAIIIVHSNLVYFCTFSSVFLLWWTEKAVARLYICTVWPWPLLLYITFNLLYFLQDVFTKANRKGCSQIVHMHSLAMAIIIVYSHLTYFCTFSPMFLLWQTEKAVARLYIRTVWPLILYIHI